MKRVLVTGANGFVGRQCLPRLVTTGYDVIALSSRQHAEETPGVQWRQADLLDQHQTSDLIGELRPTHLLHLAWITQPCKFWSSAENLDWLAASMSLLRAFEHNGGQRAVLTGSCAEYDWTSGNCDEANTPLSPATVYGKCKHAMHMFARALHERGKLNMAWGRLFFLYGPHGHPEKFPGQLIEKLLVRQQVACSHGDQVRDFLHVADAADALVALLASDVTGAVNVASGVPVRLRDMMDRISHRLQGEDCLQIGALPARADEPQTLTADVSRLRDELGWTPHFDLDSGLEDTIQWWERNRRSHAA